MVALASPDAELLRDCVEQGCCAGWKCKPPNISKTVHDTRLGAARQYVDAVFIYEAFATSEQTSNPLAVTKLALVGFFLARWSSPLPVQT